MTKTSLLIAGRQISLIVISVALLGVAVWHQPSVTHTAIARPHHTTTRATTSKAPVSAAPLTTLPSPATFGDCSQGTTLNVVAHEDDDILFINPTIQNALNANQCVMTVYVTAGDNGQSSRYWLKREAGAEAAYAAMVHVQDVWNTEKVIVHGHTVKLRRLAGDHRIALLFMRLPDGDTDGSGFNSTHHQSLLKLRNGSIAAIDAVDGSSRYTRAELIASLQSIITAVAPQTINTLAYGSNTTNADHADHQTVGYFTATAAKNDLFNGRLQTFYGYQLNQMPANLSSDQANNKQRVFNAYVSYDSIICSNTSDCYNDVVYQNFFSRQYEAARP